jgi:hypothetical protein
MSAETIGNRHAFPSGTNLGVSTALLVAAHAMHGLIAGTVARNGINALQDEDARGELIELASTLGDRLIETVEIAAVRETNDWRHQRIDKLETNLRSVLEAIANRERKDAGEVMSHSVYESILERARQELEDSDIPF